jgi:hypothetical protein
MHFSGSAGWGLCQQKTNLLSEYITIASETEHCDAKSNQASLHTVAALITAKQK